MRTAFAVVLALAVVSPVLFADPPPARSDGPTVIGMDGMTHEQYQATKALWDIERQILLEDQAAAEEES